MIEKILSKNIYLPFSYLEKVKRVGENYTRRIVFEDDLPILLFAFSWQATHPILHGLGIFCLLVSFWCVYELGYYENDYVAEKYEQQPKLSITYNIYKQMMKTKYPWLWSLIFGLCGVAILQKSLVEQSEITASFLKYSFTSFHPLLLFCCWSGLLVSVRVCFRIYNYFNKATRTWVYMVLQFFRYYGFVVVTPTNLIGTSLLCSNILTRSILYITYRYCGGSVGNWPERVPKKLFRWLIFILILVTLSIGLSSLELWQSWQTWAIFIWCLIQGKGQIIKALAQAKPVFTDGSNLVQQADDSPKEVKMHCNGKQSIT